MYRRWSQLLLHNLSTFLFITLQLSNVFQVKNQDLRHIFPWLCHAGRSFHGYTTLLRNYEFGRSFASAFIFICKMDCTWSNIYCSTGSCGKREAEEPALFPPCQPASEGNKAVLSQISKRLCQEIKNHLYLSSPVCRHVSLRYRCDAWTLFFICTSSALVASTYWMRGRKTLLNSSRNRMTDIYDYHNSPGHM